MQSRQARLGVAFLVAAMVVLVALVFINRAIDPVSDEQEAVLTEMSDLTDSAQAAQPTDAPTGTIEPPQPDAPEDFPAVTSDAVRTEDRVTTPEALSFTIVEELAHDTNAFTQGFEIADGRLFESTGLVGQSSIRELDPETGDVLRSTPVDDVFAEGLTIVDDTAIQITWQDQIAYRRDLETFDVIETYSYEGQGWGICHNGSQLVMSDGTSTLDFRDAETFEVQSSIDVTFRGEPIDMINELECVDGSVWANIWLSSLIIEIDPATGEVIGVLNANALTPLGLTDSGAVLNGIAFDPSDGTFLLTGKLWPTTYRVQIEPTDQ